MEEGGVLGGDENDPDSSKDNRRQKPQKSQSSLSESPLNLRGKEKMRLQMKLVSSQMQLPTMQKPPSDYLLTRKRSTRDGWRNRLRRWCGKTSSLRLAKRLSLGPRTKVRLRCSCISTVNYERCFARREHCDRTYTDRRISNNRTLVLSIQRAAYFFKKKRLLQPDIGTSSSLTHEPFKAALPDGLRSKFSSERRIGEAEWVAINTANTHDLARNRQGTVVRSLKLMPDLCRFTRARASESQSMSPAKSNPSPNFHNVDSISVRTLSSQHREQPNSAGSYGSGSACLRDWHTVVKCARPQPSTTVGGTAGSMIKSPNEGGSQTSSAILGHCLYESPCTSRGLKSYDPKHGTHEPPTSNKPALRSSSVVELRRPG